MSEDRQTIELRQKAEAACSIAAYPQRMATHDPRELPCLACGVIRLLEALAAAEAEVARLVEERHEAPGVPRADNPNARYWRSRWQEAQGQAERNKQFRGLYEAEREARIWLTDEVARLRAVWDNWTRENLALAEVARVQAMGPLSPSNFSPEAVDPRG